MTSSFPTGDSTGDETGAAGDGEAVETMTVDEEPAPLPPTMGYRQLARRLSGVDPRVVDLIERGSRAFADNVKSYLATDATTRDTPLTDAVKEKKRKRVAEVSEKLDEVRKERRLLDAHLGSSTPAQADGTLPRNRKVTNKAIKDKTTTHILGEDENYARPFGHQKGAFNLNPGGVLAAYPEMKIGEQTRQYLGNLSNLLFERVSTMEVEAMLANDRVLVSTNETDTVTSLAGLDLGAALQGAAGAVVADNSDHALLRRYKIGVVGEALRAVPADAELTPGHLAGAKELAELETGFRADHDGRRELESFLRVLKNHVQNALTVQGPFSIDEAAQRLVDPAYKHKVLAVKALDGGKSHAEQHLVLALIKSGHTGKAVVAGTKRPCAMCWLTLALAHQNGWNVEFNNEPGGFWDTTVIRGLAAVAQELGVGDITDLWNMFVHTNRIQPGGTQFVQYLTSLREGTNLIVNVPETGGGLAGQGLTQDISGLHKDFMEATPDSPMGSPFEDPPASPPGYWGTPPGSPSRQEAEEQQERYDRWLADQSAKPAEEGTSSGKSDETSD
ncbi:hypothetical protein [Actinophytocola sp. KF-1]